MTSFLFFLKEIYIYSYIILPLELTLDDIVLNYCLLDSNYFTFAKDNFITVISLCYRRLTGPNITAQLNQFYEKNVSTSTVRKRLCQAGLYGRITVKKTLSGKQDNKLRCTDWAIELWNQVIWIDVSKFEIFVLKRRVYVQWKVIEKAATHCITPTGEGSVMVCMGGTFFNCKVKDFDQVKSQLNQIGYPSILQHHVMLSGMQLVGQGFVLMQDNDQKHISKLCQSYIKSKEEQQS